MLLSVSRVFLFAEAALSRVIVAGFLQVTENWKRSGNLSGQGKVRENMFFKKSGKSRENEKLVPLDVRFSG